MSKVRSAVLTAPNTALGPGPEFDTIRSLVDRLGSRATGIGDDAAILRVPRGDVLVASVDALIERRHFERAWIEPREIGFRATSAAMSDLAAMGAWPLGTLVALGIPESWRGVLGEITDGIAEALVAADSFALGGNMSAASELSITTTVLGHTFRPMQRSGASAGDSLYVTGVLGGPTRAIAAWKRGEVPEQWHRERFARPCPRLAEARWLAAHGATSAIDISDGLVADLGHLAAANGLVAEIELDRVPVIDGATPADAVQGGEEYELIIAGPRELSVGEFESTFGLRLTRIGDLRAGPPEVRVTWRGSRVDVPGGFNHVTA
jgi:thiamine-monophosphate kinase